MFLVSVLDESSDRDKTVSYGVGGIIADQRQWNAFETAWDPTNKRLKARGIEFHMSDCEMGYKDFKGMERPARVEIITSLVSCLG